MYQQQQHHHHHHHPVDAGTETGANINAPAVAVRRPVAAIVIIAAMYLATCGAEDFSHSYVVFNPWLAGVAIALVIVGAVVRLLRRPGRIRREEAEIARAYQGVVEKNNSVDGVSTPTAVAYVLTIRCQDGNLIQVLIPAAKGHGAFQVGHKVVKLAGERWPRDVRGGEYQVIP